MKMGAHHTLEIELNNKLTLGKDRLRHPIRRSNSAPGTLRTGGMPCTCSS